MRVSKLRAGITLVACLCAYAGFAPAMAEEGATVWIAAEGAASIHYVVDGVKTKVPSLDRGTWALKGASGITELLIQPGYVKATLSISGSEVYVILTLDEGTAEVTYVSKQAWPNGEAAQATTAAVQGAPKFAAHPEWLLSAEGPEVVSTPAALSSDDVPTYRVYALTLQGGDTCGTAVAIGPGLPISVSGTTVGYADDYEEVCPYTSTSPDVVYAFTPSANTVVTMTLCLGMTDYDTKMFVYENDCASAYYACNDDACTSAAGQNYVSELASLSVTGGNTYYIVIDGYDGGSGNYFLDITESDPPPGCPPETINNDNAPIGQPPELIDWAAINSDEGGGYMGYEKFWDVFLPICDIHWWGINAFFDGSAWVACDKTNERHEITFYVDAGGVPGAVACGPYTVTPIKTDSGATYGGYPLYEYAATLDPCCIMETGWVSILGLDDGQNCWFLWANSTIGGDGFSKQWDFAANDWGADNDYDLSLCLTPSGADIYGACCDDWTGDCDDSGHQSDSERYCCHQCGWHAFCDT